MRGTGRVQWDTTVDDGQQVRCQDLGQITSGSRSLTMGLTEKDEGTISCCILENNKCDDPQE